MPTNHLPAAQDIDVRAIHRAARHGVQDLTLDHAHAGDMHIKLFNSIRNGLDLQPELWFARRDLDAHAILVPYEGKICQTLCVRERLHDDALRMAHVEGRRGCRRHEPHARALHGQPFGI